MIQQVGLFPHMTIAENVATVPQLLGWPADKTARRVDEMLALVGLGPGNIWRAIRATSRAGSASASAWRARSRPIRR